MDMGTRIDCMAQPYSPVKYTIVDQSVGTVGRTTTLNPLSPISMLQYTLQMTYIYKIPL